MGYLSSTISPSVRYETDVDLADITSIVEDDRIDPAGSQTVLEIAVFFELLRKVTPYVSNDKLAQEFAKACVSFDSNYDVDALTREFGSWLRHYRLDIEPDLGF